MMQALTVYGEIDLRMHADFEEKMRFYTGILLGEKYVTQFLIFIIVQFLLVHGLQKCYKCPTYL
jgi:hypothetical protein